MSTRKKSKKTSVVTPKDRTIYPESDIVRQGPVTPENRVGVVKQEDNKQEIVPEDTNITENVTQGNSGVDYMNPWDTSTGNRREDYYTYNQAMSRQSKINESMKEPEEVTTSTGPLAPTEEDNSTDYMHPWNTDNGNAREDYYTYNQNLPQNETAPREETPEDETRTTDEGTQDGGARETEPGGGARETEPGGGSQGGGAREGEDFYAEARSIKGPYDEYVKSYKSGLDELNSPEYTSGGAEMFITPEVGEKPDRDAYHENIDFVNKYGPKPLDPEVKEARIRSAYNAAAIGGLGNALSAFSNLFFTGKGAPSQTLPETPNIYNEVESFNKEQDDKAQKYLSALMQARGLDQGEYAQAYNEYKSAVDTYNQIKQNVFSNKLTVKGKQLEGLGNLASMYQSDYQAAMQRGNALDMQARGFEQESKENESNRKNQKDIVRIQEAHGDYRARLNANVQMRGQNMDYKVAMENIRLNREKFNFDRTQYFQQRSDALKALDDANSIALTTYEGGTIKLDMRMLTPQSMPTVYMHVLTNDKQKKQFKKKLEERASLTEASITTDASGNAMATITSGGKTSTVSASALQSKIDAIDNQLMGMITKAIGENQNGAIWLKNHGYTTGYTDGHVRVWAYAHDSHGNQLYDRNGKPITRFVYKDTRKPVDPVATAKHEKAVGAHVKGAKTTTKTTAKSNKKTIPGF